ncbi:transcriptional regulator, TetR family [Anaerovirgula multivorans]|uniref:Transcriptional regulator, TetR family n=1 Tax=Anaerovirgula multivorans TaxID=312168 RepID=A0A239D6L1_9FIRM|nr:TetR/AcrR family transcriptional regulator [Anaerovirgula multivorans]SNS27980.1 transcriptional regulator, TetR family [Anaerovirgula multivorans]
MPVEKESDVKQALLNTAMELFYKKGYDATSVNAIIEKVGVSKGAFYHYFKSKEEVLEAVVEQHIEKEIEITHDIAANNDLNAIEKLSRLINEVLGYKTLNIKKRLKISSVLQDEGNVKFQRKVVENKFKILHLPYRVIIEQGISEGTFHPFHTEETVEQIMHLIVILNSAVTRLAANIEEKPHNVEIIVQKIEAYGDAIERILGIQRGSINLSEIIKIFEKHL